MSIKFISNSRANKEVQIDDLIASSDYAIFRKSGDLDNCDEIYIAIQNGEEILSNAIIKIEDFREMLTFLCVEDIAAILGFENNE